MVLTGRSVGKKKVNPFDKLLKGQLLTHGNPGKGMSSRKDATQSHPDPGLCRNCQHSRRIESDRGSIFFRCELSLEDPRFPKYPRLPVFKCSGYRSAEEV